MTCPACSKRMELIREADGNYHFYNFQPAQPPCDICKDFLLVPETR